MLVVYASIVLLLCEGAWWLAHGFRLSGWTRSFANEHRSAMHGSIRSCEACELKVQHSLGAYVFSRALCVWRVRPEKTKC